MDYKDIINDKLIKPSAKAGLLANWVLENPEKINEYIDYAATAKDAVKASCIEALEHASNGKPDIVNLKGFEFATNSLADKAPRVKWESARVIGNTASLYPDKIEKAITNLLVNTEHSGTVVRWSAAYALGQIVKQKTSYNQSLVPAIKVIILREEKNSIKKIYLDAFKKSGIEK